MRVLSLLLTASIFLVSPPAYAISTKVKTLWVTDKESILSVRRPKAFDTCKEISRIEGKTITLQADEFIYDRYDQLIEIQNNSNQSVKSITIEFTKSRKASSILYYENLRYPISPKESVRIQTSYFPARA